MNSIHLLIIIVTVSLISACSKDNNGNRLPSGSISIMGLAAKDTLVKEVSIAKDTFVIIGLKAVLEGELSEGEHIVSFRPDTTRISTYRSKYGEATLLPAESYFFFRSQCRIPAGASISDSVQLNIVEQKRLKPLTVYVLPVSIRSVDGSIDPVAAQQILYIVVKTGKSPTISKVNWSIVSVSSSSGPGNAAEFVLDNDINTVWSSAFAPMPQNMVIDFAEQVTFSGVSYSLPADFFPYGGYPKKIKIEVSNDKTSWQDKGTYDGTVVPTTGTMNTGLTTARYMRFTVLESQPYVYFGLELTWIGDISLIP